MNHFGATFLVNNSDADHFWKGCLLALFIVLILSSRIFALGRRTDTKEMENALQELEKLVNDYEN